MQKNVFGGQFPTEHNGMTDYLGERNNVWETRKIFNKIAGSNV